MVLLPEKSQGKQRRVASVPTAVLACCEEFSVFSFPLSQKQTSDKREVAFLQAVGKVAGGCWSAVRNCTGEQGIIAWEQDQTAHNSLCLFYKYTYLYCTCK